MMGKLGIAEDEPIENRLITRSLESAQTKIEGFNFDARKHVLEYDDVLNFQRSIIYSRRKKILLGENSGVDEFLDQIEAENSAEIFEKKKEELGSERFYKTVRTLTLQASDFLWVDHLEMMDYLRSSVNLRAYGQRDPLVEYKKESLKLFKEMEEALKHQVFQTISNLSLEMLDSQKTSAPKKIVIPESKNSEKVGRNDPCPCGSGLKYKKCGLINAPEHKKS